MTNEKKQNLAANVSIEKGTILQTLWHENELVFDELRMHIVILESNILNNFEIKTFKNILI